MLVSQMFLSIYLSWINFKKRNSCFHRVKVPNPTMKLPTQLLCASNALRRDGCWSGQRYLFMKYWTEPARLGAYLHKEHPIESRMFFCRDPDPKAIILPLQKKKKKKRRRILYCFPIFTNFASPAGPRAPNQHVPLRSSFKSDFQNPCPWTQPRSSC